ncbi:late secretory pathway protein AVL9 homolog [Tribolium madens]|uniref:late secretory pathway protein AVL9 homolog n=1 Tax=Tribolium madens TaxID=41895 RepID=UPI001CF7493F|nr:late secretory pathway protein AVL9 homolog [Tribolium madens]
MEAQDGPILYVIVVGFHHKKGCQVEFSFPPLVPESPNECPPGWKYLPTLALPDGSHNYDEDTVFFHLPSLNNPKQTIYGISCFRQIPIEKIKNRTSDMTRGTIQKSVCVLSKIPLYGQIQVKMSLITHAYFDEGDFSKVSLLEDTYHHLNSVLTQNDFQQQIFVGLSAREFVLHWRHKAILLFKLLLLERRLIFYKSPVHPLCSTILTLASLFPEMIEKGMDQSACIRLSRPMSPMPEYSDDDQSPHSSPSKTQIENIDSTNQNVSNEELNNKEVNILEHCEDEDDKNSSLGITEVGIEITEASQQNETNSNGKNNSLQRDISSDTIADSMHNNMAYLAHLSTSSCGFPLSIFTKGYMCLPYLSLPYLDLVTDVNVRGYVVGATNILFKQKSQLYDVLVDVDAARIECQDLELRKQLHLTTEDLRFADYIVKHVSEERHDVFLDGVGWEGGDEWIRTQFRIYLLCLMRTSLSQDGSREIEHFNTNFVTSWRDTHNYKIWLSGINPGILDVNPGHPFAGQLSVADMKLRLAHTMQSSDSGRKLNQAMVSTGRAVATTSKAVGGAFSQAKGVFSNWWSNLLVSPEPVQKALEAFPDNDMQVENSTENENIPKNVNLSNGNIEKNNFSDDGSECTLPNNIHQPGEVHTV